MRSELVSIGTELVRGFVREDNARFLARELESVGFRVVAHHTVGDDPVEGRELLRRALSRADLVVATGGIGPTADDRTREMVAGATGAELVLDERRAAAIARWLEDRGVRVFPAHREQARLPRGARVLENRRGTAPGFLLETGGSRLAVLPGVPHEMEGMWRDELAPILAELLPPAEAATTRVLRIFGLPESEVAEVLRGAMESGGPLSVGITASRGTLAVYLQATGPPGERERRLRDVEVALRERFGAWIYGEGEEDLATVVGRELIARRRTIALAESCTGGRIAEMLTSVPGISRVFVEGAVTYSDEAKVRALGVPREVLERHGAVSEPVARAMAEGIARLASVDLAVSVTGIAGPAGGSAAKPVGLVYIGVAAGGATEVTEHRFPGDRDFVRQRAALMALSRVRRRIAPG